MSTCVAPIGFFNAVLGASKEVWLSVLALGLMGAFDMVSIYIATNQCQLAIKVTATSGTRQR